ncbi:transcriptional regulator [Caldimicrobium thiodismutans]|uniref:Transcriptional regulator n=1 Tax=Caldimicrobium thiodismutans TaxID=1653476 RepID=A0A0U4W3X4_9BACT|nr:winged helix-turn-helix transcriptional regulator [Caldimicrobium thiodismutans]BAU23802.1 transcriptional regulator [Caldimicrobium thiodismutans]
MKTLLECKWALQILKYLAEGPKRPSELLRIISGISERILFDRLRALEREGIIYKKSSSGYPLRTLYYLDHGAGLDELISLISKVSENTLFLKVLSSKWMIPILKALKDPAPPKELLIRFRNLSQKVLYENLKVMVEIGLIERKVIPSIPVKVVYQLSREGEKILPALLKAKSIILSTGKRRSPGP